MRNHPASASHFHFGNVFANIAVVPAISPDGWDEMGSVTGRAFIAVDFNAEAQSRREIECQPVADSTLVADKAATSWQNYTFSIFHPPFACTPANRYPYTVSYAYDHRGRMVSKRITENDGNDTLVKSVSYLWDGWNIIRETATDFSTFQPFNFSTDYVWGLDLDGTLQGAGGVGGLLAVVRDDGVFLPTYDANGNVSEYVSTNGSIVAHYDYSPFGETLIASGDLASSFTHRFSTKPWSPVTGLYEYQMRKYRPEIGRWMSRDPREDNDLFLYVYCKNSSVSNIDVYGLKSLDFISLLEGVAKRLSAGRDFSKLIARPYLPALNALLQIHAFGTINFYSCCIPNEGKMGIMYEMIGGLEGFLQWGGTLANKEVYDGYTDKKGFFHPLPTLETYDVHRPNKGYRERNKHIDLNAGTRPCPKSVVVSSWSTKAFLRGSFGAGVGIQGGFEMTVVEKGFDPNSFWDRFTGSASFAWGIAGESLELGINASFGLVGRIL